MLTSANNYKDQQAFHHMLIGTLKFQRWKIISVKPRNINMIKCYGAYLNKASSTCGNCLWFTFFCWNFELHTWEINNLGYFCFSVFQLVCLFDHPVRDSSVNIGNLMLCFEVPWHQDSVGLNLPVPLLLAYWLPWNYYLCSAYLSLSS